MPWHLVSRQVGSRLPSTRSCSARGKRTRARAQGLVLNVFLIPFLPDGRAPVSLWNKSCQGLALWLNLLTFCRLARWLSTFIAAWFSLKLLQSKDSDAFVDHVTVDTPTGRVERPIRWAGRTMDLSLFAVTRALDVIIGELWSHRKARRTGSGKRSTVNCLSLYSKFG
jgi:hypothetical protein